MKQGAADLQVGEQQTFQRRLLDGLVESIVDIGYKDTTVADIVRRARTSRRTFYEHFSSKEECFVALLKDANAEMIREISAAVDPTARWVTQVRQAIVAWIACAESQPGIVVSWIRDVPALGASGRALQREMMAAFIDMVRALSEADEWRAVRPDGVSRQLAILMLGGLRELIATTVEEGGRAGDITEVAVNATIALLAPPGALSV
jgi:AcrR family transcriptional regulator